MQVGSTVRAQYHGGSLGESKSVPIATSKTSTITRRAIIASVNETEACLFWDADVPQPLNNPFRIAPRSYGSIKVAPRDDEETTMLLENLIEVFDFEQIPIVELVSSNVSVSEWKDFGDRLVRVGDFVAAIAYYEHALQISSTLQVGCTVLIRVPSGHVVGAEVDCLDNDTVDVTLTTGGEETVVPQRDILLCRMESEDSFQERILMNLARCFLQLAGMTSPSWTVRRPLYLKSAVLATTLAITALAMDNDARRSADDKSMCGATLGPYRISALLLRSRAQEERNKIPHAMADVQSILKTDPHHKQGKIVWNRLQQHQCEADKRSKKLARDVSQWVQKAMNQCSNDESIPSQEHMNEKTESKLVSTQEQRMIRATLALKSTSTNHCTFWASVAAAIVFSWLVMQQ